MEKLKNWFSDAASIMFDDTRNDFRSLPKTVRLQLLTVFSFLWSLLFSLYVFNLTTFALGFAGVFLGHVLLIILTYYTFKVFYRARKRQQTGFEETNALNYTRDCINSGWVSSNGKWVNYFENQI